MPARNSIKPYSENAYYHLYNRGVEKRKIFLDQQDFAVFLSYLKEYLLPKDTASLTQTISSKTSNPKEKQKASNALLRNNFFQEIELLSYVLMPNHYHFLLKQKNSNAIDSFINSLGTRYTMYFNKKYKRIGRLYQGVYKAVLIDTDEQLLHTSKYIHQNPLKIGDATLPSSLPEYLGQKTTSWLNCTLILNYFRNTNPNNSYASFMNLPLDSEFIAPLSLDITEE
jgi:putative transposase